jgi:hypothetical protein
MGECPGTTGTYFSDEQICSTLRAADFFGLLPAGGSGSGGSGGSGSGSGGSDGSGSGGSDGGGSGGSNGDNPGSGMLPGGGCDAGGGSGRGAGALALIAGALVIVRRRRA